MNSREVHHPKPYDLPASSNHGNRALIGVRLRRFTVDVFFEFLKMNADRDGAVRKKTQLFDVLFIKRYFGLRPNSLWSFRMR